MAPRREKKLSPFDYSDLKKMFGQHPVIVFIGSAHKPNIDALNFIADTLASKLSNCYFVVIGTVCAALKRSRLRNLLLFDKMEEEFKDILLRVCDVAINPMFSGSGSNLKLANISPIIYPWSALPWGFAAIGSRIIEKQLSVKKVTSVKRY